jgi:FKBP-type peptidyl-prolyl cis-trans isomerase FklB
MGKSLAQEGMDDLDSKAVAQGIEDAVGKKEQRLKDEELVEAFTALQKRAEERLAKASEEAAAAGKKFLEENAKKPAWSPPLRACSTKWSRRPMARSQSRLT